jgi:hypothetical protein
MQNGARLGAHIAIGARVCVYLRERCARVR